MPVQNSTVLLATLSVTPDFADPRNVAAGPGPPGLGAELSTKRSLCRRRSYHGKYPLGIKHGWLENLRTEWTFIARRITDLYGPFFQPAMFDYRRVHFSKWLGSSNGQHGATGELHGLIIAKHDLWDIWPRSWSHADTVGSRYWGFSTVRNISVQ